MLAKLRLGGPANPSEVRPLKRDPEPTQTPHPEKQAASSAQIRATIEGSNPADALKLVITMLEVIQAKMIGEYDHLNNRVSAIELQIKDLNRAVAGATESKMTAKHIQSVDQQLRQLSASLQALSEKIDRIEEQQHHQESPGGSRRGTRIPSRSPLSMNSSTNPVLSSTDSGSGSDGGSSSKLMLNRSMPTEIQSARGPGDGRPRGGSMIVRRMSRGFSSSKVTEGVDMAALTAEDKKEKKKKKKEKKEK